MNNPIKSLTRREWCLWLASLAVVLIANQITPELDPLTMTAALVGVTSLVFAAKGNVWSQVLMIVFSILYGVISFRFHYWGEMITYLGMTLPMAVWSTVTWLKNPSKENGSEVAIQTLARSHLAALAASTVAVAAVFYYILKLLDTPNLFFSTVSIITSFLAAALTMLRSSYYAVGYAANDVVLIVLWVMASMKNPASMTTSTASSGPSPSIFQMSASPRRSSIRLPSGSGWRSSATSSTSGKACSPI